MIFTTLNIYADVTRELKKEEFAGLDSYFKKDEKTADSKATGIGKKRGKRTA